MSKDEKAHAVRQLVKIRIAISLLQVIIEEVKIPQELDILGQAIVHLRKYQEEESYYKSQLF